MSVPDEAQPNRSSKARQPETGDAASPTAEPGTLSAPRPGLRLAARVRLADSAALLGLLVLAKLLLHVLTLHRYGYFRDELYYMACGEHLDWSYVDHPPLVPVLTRVIRALLGDSLLALRILPALAGSLVVLLAGLMARQLGGGRYAQALAALAVLVSPAFLVMGTFLSVNALDMLWWTVCCYLLIRILNEGDPRTWLIIGLVVGLGLLTKYTILFMAAGLLVGLLLTSARRHLLSGWLWLGAVIALAVLSPNLVWQIRHGWPTLEFLHNIRLHKNYPVSPFEFLAMQFAVVHPLVFPIWVVGLCACISSQRSRRYRLIGWAYLAVFGIFMLLKAKFYYLFPIYPALLAAGAVSMERCFERNRRAWLKPVTATILILGGAMTVPYAVPVLTMDGFLQYDNLLRIDREIRFERGRERNQHVIYADMLGWPELVCEVARVYDQLPPQERVNCRILTSNYGEAGAIDFFGARHSLPKAISGHNAYYFWGAGDRPWQVVIAVGFEEATLRALFEDVTRAATVHHEHAREGAIAIHTCRNAAVTKEEAWARLKKFR